MIIIEAGGSSTQVCQILNGKQSSIQTYDGISPYYMNKDEIISVLEQILNAQAPDTELAYYGTGCSQESAKARIQECISHVRRIEHVTISSDLLAAARATANQKNGQINILGTGAASCLYKDLEIKQVYFNSGYLFGDYGSGFQLGQSFLRAYFENTFNPEIENEIQAFSGVSKQALIQKIYSADSPKQVVAHFARCMHRMKQKTEVNKILEASFSKFIHYQIQLNSKYKSTPQYFVGSIAYFFKEELTQAMKASQLEVSNICQAPLEKLIEYHLT